MKFQMFITQKNQASQNNKFLILLFQAPTSSALLSLHHLGLLLAELKPMTPMWVKMQRLSIAFPMGMDQTCLISSLTRTHRKGL